MSCQCCVIICQCHVMPISEIFYSISLLVLYFPYFASNKPRRSKFQIKTKASACLFKRIMSCQCCVIMSMSFYANLRFFLLYFIVCIWFPIFWPAWLQTSHEDPNSKSKRILIHATLDEACNADFMSLYANVILCQSENFLLYFIVCISFSIF